MEEKTRAWVTPSEEGTKVDGVGEGVNKVEFEVMVNALPLIEIHVTSINLISSVSIAMSMNTLLKIVPTQTVERRLILL